MTGKDIKDVLTFAAFRPEPDDSSASWSKRFPKKRSVLLNIGRDSVSWRAIEKGGDLGESGAMDGDFKEIITDMAEEWKSMADEAWIGVSLNNRFMITLETNLSRKKGAVEAIRTNPKAALGTKAEKGKRYAVNHNPESNTSVLLAVDEDFVNQVETLMKAVGINVGRIACGPYAMLMDCIDQVDIARRQFKDESPDQALGKVVMVVCCEGSVVAMTTNDDQWLELRSRTSLYTEDDVEPVIKIITPLIDNAGSDAQIIFMGDATATPVKALLESRLNGRRFSDVSQPDQLWSLIKQH
ncbi:MAG: hypothetical protein ACI9UA_000735 [Pseudoalteromonas tetraodonis]|jgi:hypothetical protein